MVTNFFRHPQLTRNILYIQTISASESYGSFCIDDTVLIARMCSDVLAHRIERIAQHLQLFFEWHHLQDRTIALTVNQLLLQAEHDCIQCKYNKYDVVNVITDVDSITSLSSIPLCPICTSMKRAFTETFNLVILQRPKDNPTLSQYLSSRAKQCQAMSRSDQ